MPKFPRVGPRNPCSPFPYGFTKGVNSVQVSGSASRGVKRGRGQKKSAPLYHDKTIPSKVVNTEPCPIRGMRSTSKDAAADLADKKARIKQRAQAVKELREKWRDPYAA